MMHGLLAGALILWATSLSAAEPRGLLSAGDRQRPSLADNESYISDGAVTSFEVCLEVANDHRAFALWEGRNGGREDQNGRPDGIGPEIQKIMEDGRSLLAALKTLPRDVKLQLGFGTIHACAQIAATWSDRSFDERSSGWGDGRRRHGMVVIDLGLGKSSYRNALAADDTDDALIHEPGTLRGSIEAIPLIRILTSPRLVPPRDFGGVTIRNAEIDGVLLFYNVDLALPLAFANVRFRGHNYPQSVFFGDERDEPIKDTAIAIVNARFNESLLISASEICGAVRLLESRFAETVAFRSTRQYGIDCDPGNVRTADPELAVRASTFEQRLSADRVDFGNFRVSGSRVQSLDSTHSRFGRYLEVTESNIGSLRLHCSVLAERVVMNGNRIGMDMLLEGTDIGVSGGQPDAVCNDWWRERRRGEKTHIAVTDNHIGGGLQLRNFIGSNLQHPLRLASNRVGSNSKVMVPGPDVNGRPWRGDVDLAGSRHEATLTLTFSHWPIGTPTTGEAPPSFCREIGSDDERTGVAVQLRAAHARTLQWDLPLTCDYRWIGYGFSYDLWLKGRLAKASLGEEVNGKAPTELDHLALYYWRQSLRRYDSSSLTTMSHYLADKGQYIESRRTLREAKQLNYAPTCPPDVGLWDCIKHIVPDLPVDSTIAQWLESARALIGGEANAQESIVTTDLAPTEPLDLGERIYQAAMVFLLWPGGYGAMPERALLYLIAAMGVFFLVYLLYSLYLRWRLTRVPGLLSALSAATTGGRAEGAGERETKGLEDVQKPIYDADGSAPSTGEDTGSADGKNDVSTTWDPTTRNAVERLLADWPNVDRWKPLKTDQRLLQVQTALSPNVDACLDAVSDQEVRAELQTVRSRLRRFGSTQKLGFSQFDGAKQPTRFTYSRYAIDTTVPFINLHAYSHYFPESAFMRFISVFQHVIGWWLMTVFIASAAIL